MNKVTKFALIFLVGTALGFFTRNMILTTLMSFFLGILVFRKSKPKKAEKPPKPAKTPSGLAYCHECGKQADMPGCNFCTNCGAKLANPTISTNNMAHIYQPAEILAKLRNLSEIDKPTYLLLMRDMLLIDRQGRYWSVGVEDMKWNRYDGKRWLPDEATDLLLMTRRSDRLLEKSSAHHER